MLAPFDVLENAPSATLNADGDIKIIECISCSKMINEKQEKEIGNEGRRRMLK